MTEGITCYARDEDICVDPICAQSGCRLIKPISPSSAEICDACNCRQPGLGGDCDGSCQHPPPQHYKDQLCLMCWKRSSFVSWYFIGESDEGPEYFCSEECFEENRR